MDSGFSLPIKGRPCCLRLRGRGGGGGGAGGRREDSFTAKDLKSNQWHALEQTNKHLAWMDSLLLLLLSHTHTHTHTHTVTRVAHSEAGLCMSVWILAQLPSTEDAKACSCNCNDLNALTFASACQKHPSNTVNINIITQIQTSPTRQDCVPSTPISPVSALSIPH